MNRAPRRSSSTTIKGNGQLLVPHVYLLHFGPLICETDVEIKRSSSNKNKKFVLKKKKKKKLQEAIHLRYLADKDGLR